MGDLLVRTIIHFEYTMSPTLPKEIWKHSYPNDDFRDWQRDMGHEFWPWTMTMNLVTMTTSILTITVNEYIMLEIIH